MKAFGKAADGVRFGVLSLFCFVSDAGGVPCLGHLAIAWAELIRPVPSALCPGSALAQRRGRLGHCLAHAVHAATPP